MIKKITQKQADEIIMSSEIGRENYKPLGKFILIENGVYVGIDNLYGNANVEEFKVEKNCINWLNREFEYEEIKNSDLEFLLQSDKCLITPHIAGWTVRAERPAMPWMASCRDTGLPNR